MEGSRRSRHLCTEGWRQTPPTSDQCVRGPRRLRVSAGRFKGVCIGIGQNDRRRVLSALLPGRGAFVSRLMVKAQPLLHGVPRTQQPWRPARSSQRCFNPKGPRSTHRSHPRAPRLAARTLEPSPPRGTPARGIRAITPVSTVGQLPARRIQIHTLRHRPNTDQPPPRIDRDQNQDDVPCDQPCDHKGRPSPVGWRTWNCESWDA